MTKRAPERTALAICLGNLDSLDGIFEQLRESGTLELSGHPSTFTHEDVLLAASGGRGEGDLYVFVGILRRCRIRAGCFAFDNVERFRCPVTAMYGKVGLAREDLIGERGGWSANPYNYVLPNALVDVPKEAQALLEFDPRHSTRQRRPT